MKITDVKIFLRDSNQLKAFANMVIDDAFIVRNIKVIEGEHGLFVAMPSRKLKSGEYRDVAHPINTETRKMIEKEILAKYDEVLKEAPDDADNKTEVEVEKEAEKTEDEKETEKGEDEK